MADDNKKNEQLRDAAKRGDAKEVERLLDQGANIDAKDSVSLRERKEARSRLLCVCVCSDTHTVCLCALRLAGPL